MGGALCPHQERTCLARSVTSLTSDSGLWPARSRARKWRRYARVRDFSRDGLQEFRPLPGTGARNAWLMATAKEMLRKTSPRRPQRATAPEATVVHELIQNERAVDSGADVPPRPPSLLAPETEHAVSNEHPRCGSGGTVARASGPRTRTSCPEVFCPGHLDHPPRDLF